MVKIRLRRTGARKKPTYRVVVTDSRAPRDGRFIEIIGHYNPRTEPRIVKIHEDRVLHWLSVGAQPTDPVKKLLRNLGTLDRFARLKEGAELEDLVAEAEAAYQRNEVAAQSDVEAVAVETEAAAPAETEAEDTSEEGAADFEQEEEVEESIK